MIVFNAKSVQCVSCLVDKVSCFHAKSPTHLEWILECKEGE